MEKGFLGVRIRDRLPHTPNAAFQDTTEISRERELRESRGAPGHTLSVWDRVWERETIHDSSVRTAPEPKGVRAVSVVSHTGPTVSAQNYSEFGVNRLPLREREREREIKGTHFRLHKVGQFSQLRRRRGARLASHEVVRFLHLGEDLHQADPRDNLVLAVHGQLVPGVERSRADAALEGGADRHVAGQHEARALRAKAHEGRHRDAAVPVAE